MAEGNEKQAGQKKWPAAICAKGHVTETPLDEGCHEPSGQREQLEDGWISLGCGEPVRPYSPPSNPEKLALRGEPTARTILQDFVDAHLNYAKLDQARDAARAYLSTRAQQEEALIDELRGALLYAVEFCERETNTIRRAVPRLNAGWRASIKDADAAAKRGRAALALPVEGRAPDASHEKQLGKKGGG